MLRLRLLDGNYPFFLLFHVYVAPYLFSLNSFQPTHPLPKRAHLLYAELPLPRSTPSPELLREYEQLLTLAQEFVVFFGEALKFHPCSKYKVRCGLARALQEGGYSRRLTHFQPADTATLQHNLRKESRNFAQELKQLVAFVTDKTEEALLDPAAYHDNLYLLLSLAETADRYRPPHAATASRPPSTGSPSPCAKTPSSCCPPASCCTPSPPLPRSRRWA